MKFENQRNHMVESQLRANLVLNENILDAFRVTKRENYFSENLKSLAYMDDNIFISDSRFVLRPFIFGKLLCNLNIGMDKNILDVGSSNGYSSSVLSQLFKKVISLEEDENCFNFVTNICKEENLQNIKVIKDSFLGIKNLDKTFDNILINGEVNSNPINLIKLLNLNGKLVTIFREEKHSYAVMYVKKENDTFDKIRIFDASAPLLINYKSVEPVFSF
jgi:protein-L-isoaspartate(D-aspartate) O-methyltransferase|tara:strand:- start:735 stop:1391 length:657 start_codon:yes stop_codon:yes gene_type:complete